MMDKTIEEQIAELWPDKCPKCHSPAWIGPVHATCVLKSCPNGSEKEAERYLKLLHQEIDQSIDLINKAIDETPKPYIFKRADPIDWAVPASGGGSGIDEDDEDTQPGLQAPSSFDWFKDFDTKLALTMKPYGKCWTERCAAEDAFHVHLYNKPTNLYVSEKFTLDECAKLGEGVATYLLRYVKDQFPRVLQQSWEFKEHAEPTVKKAIADHFANPATQFLYEAHQISLPEGMAQYLHIGQTIEEWTVISIDRCNDTFTIKAWV